MAGWVFPGQEYPGGVPNIAVNYADTPTGTITLSGSASDQRVYSDAPTGTLTLTGTCSDQFALVYADAPTGTLTLDGTAADERVYSDAPLGVIGGTTVTTTPQVIVLGGRTPQQQQQRPQQPPKPVRIVISESHDQPAGILTLGGTVTEAWTPNGWPVTVVYHGAPPTREDVISAHQRIRQHLAGRP